MEKKILATLAVDFLMKQILVFVMLLMPTMTAAQFLDDVEGEDDLKQFTVDDEKYGYFLSSSKWSGTEIRVCWESTDDEFSSQRADVQTAIDETWARYSALEFKGWKKCPTSSFAGIRIRTADEHPHVKRLGAGLSGLKRGMVLNFEYNIESFSSCNASTFMYNMCNRAIAVHEFGHALGFAHEHNRTDKDVSCAKPPQGSDGDTLLTPYDPDSAMNYCNPKYGNYGKLSHFDVISVQTVYGKP